MSARALVVAAAIATVAGARALLAGRLRRQLTGMSHPAPNGAPGLAVSNTADAPGAPRADGPLTDMSLTGTDRPVDHDRVPGVPPSSALDDFDDIVDIKGAGSFPASDPPGGW